MDKIIEAVLTSELSEEDAAKVKAALEAVTSDPAVGTVLRNPATGDVAVRVHQYAEFYWRVYSTDDRTWIETEPLVGWDTVFAPVSADARPAEAVKPTRKRVAK